LELHVLERAVEDRHCNGALWWVVRELRFPKVLGWSASGFGDRDGR
jgi:hypothetical protein